MWRVRWGLDSTPAHFRTRFADDYRLVTGVAELPLWADGSVERNDAWLPEPVVDLDVSRGRRDCAAARRLE